MSGFIADPEIIVLFHVQIRCCDPSLETSRGDSSNEEGSQHTFSVRNEENYP